jgi:hypothetical protein
VWVSRGHAWQREGEPQALSHEQEREAAAMLLPNVLPFKLKQTEGRAGRNQKARRAAAQQRRAVRNQRFAVFC